MNSERDEVTFLGGVGHGLTLGSPVAIMVGNTEWPKWEQVMAADPVDPEVLAGLARNAPLTHRPGHADLAGMHERKREHFLTFVGVAAALIEVCQTNGITRVVGLLAGC
jgi:chorismate synthase